MDSASDNISKEYENWLRLMTLIHFGGKHLCRDVLFSRENLPTDGALLFKKLEHLKPRMQFENQKRVLCPSSDIIYEYHRKTIWRQIQTTGERLAKCEEHPISQREPNAIR